MIIVGTCGKTLHHTQSGGNFQGQPSFNHNINVASVRKKRNKIVDYVTGKDVDILGLM